jgi:hypothetical protein
MHIPYEEKKKEIPDEETNKKAKKPPAGKVEA